MLQRSYIPSPPLSAYVHSFWMWEGYVPQHSRERLLPDGSTALVLSLRDEPFSVGLARGTQSETFRSGVVMGPHSEFFVLDAASQEAVIGVHFKAGGAAPFLRIPVGELHNLHVSVRDVFGPAGDLVWEAVREAKNPVNRFRIIEDFLVSRLLRTDGRHPAVAFALQEFKRFPEEPLAEILERVGLRSKRFIEVFRAEVGITPKLYRRVKRFQALLRLLTEGAVPSWTEAALRCGYFDQAHSIHDFRAFSGLSPTEYVRAQPRNLNHVPIII